MQHDDPYAVLGLTYNTFDINKLDKVYRNLSKKYHPDKNEGQVLEMFHKIQTAYGILSDDKKREEYDKTIKAKIFQEKKMAEMDVNRKRMKEKLEEKEREAKKRKMEEQQAKYERTERMRREVYKEYSSKPKTSNQTAQPHQPPPTSTQSTRQSSNVSEPQKQRSEKDKSFSELYDLPVPSLEELENFEQKVFRMIDSLCK